MERAAATLLAPVGPVLLFAISDCLGRLSYPFRWPALHRDVAEFFTGSVFTNHRKTALENQATYFRNMALRFLVRNQGMDFIKPVITIHKGETLIQRYRKKEPTILVVCHVGPPAVVFAALDLLKISATVIRHQKEDWMPDRFEMCTTAGGPGEKAAVLKRAIKRLQEGGFVVFAIDEWEGAGGWRFPFMGRQLPFRRGIAAASRITGADVIPVSSIWTKGKNRIAVTVDQPLKRDTERCKTPQAFELDIMRQAVGWSERQVKRYPFQVSPIHMKRYCRVFEAFLSDPHWSP